MSQMYSLGSGNRWEPTAPDAAASADADQPHQPDDAATPPATRSRLQPAALVTGAAAVVLLAGALGGFAVGRASADDDAPAGTSTSSGTDGSPSGEGRPGGGPADADGDGPPFAGFPPGSTPDGSIPDGSIPDGSIPDGSIPDGSLPEGNGPDGTDVSWYVVDVPTTRSA